MFDVFYLTQPVGIPGAKKADSIAHAQDLCRTRFCWILDYLCDYSDFDLLWEPPPWENQQAHAWPSQHQENSGTYLVPKHDFEFVNRDHAMVVRTKSAPRLHIKHRPSGPDPGDANTRFISDYLGTLRRALSKVDWHWCWVTSDLCDYADFDFTWHPSEWQDKMLHVWRSNEQKFGDTFYLHVPTFLERSKDIKLLEWFDTINFVPKSVPRYPPPVIKFESDSVVPAVWGHDFVEPVVQFYRYDPEPITPTVNLWRPETRAVTPLRPGSESVLVPRDTKNYIVTQIYDYPVISSSDRDSASRPLDVIFISNGEMGADTHWDMLNQSLHSIYHNKIQRIDGINGRVAAYQTAAQTSTTDWFFAVFAKLQINSDFDWNWQPDRLQEAKHYIFHAFNPVNNLVYGHQAMIAYNRRLVLENAGKGLDFTLDQLHEVVPLISGTAYYDNDPWTCWRTAFREVIKLRHSLPDVENEYRLQQWLDVGQGPNGHWSTSAAKDAMDYYDRVQGDFDELKKTYEWDWLASYAMILHPELFTQSRI